MNFLSYCMETIGYEYEKLLLHSYIRFVQKLILKCSYTQSSQSPNVRSWLQSLLVNSWTSRVTTSTQVYVHYVKMFHFSPYRSCLSSKDDKKVYLYFNPSHISLINMEYKNHETYESGSRPRKPERFHQFLL